MERQQAAPALFLRCFGRPALLVRDSAAAESILLGPGKPLLLLACLDVHPAGVARETLASLGWADHDDRHARASLRQAIFKLRTILGAEAILADGELVQLKRPIPSDCAHFIAAIERDDDAAACACYAGSFLDGVDAADSDGLHNWLLHERNRFASLWRDAAIRRSRALLEQGRRAESASLASAVTRAVPNAIAAWEVLLDALADTGSAGRRREALAHLDAVLQGNSLQPAAASAAATLYRLHHRETVGSTARAPVSPQLPLVGRHPLVQRLLHQVASGTSRAVVLEGSAGMGKSRVLQDLVDRIKRHGSNAALVAAIPSERRMRWALLNRVVRSVGASRGASGIDRLSAETLVRLDPQLVARFPVAHAVSTRPLDAAEVGAALADLLLAAHAEVPLVLLLDDLHLGDPDSLQVIASALGVAAAEGVAVIAAARPWHRHVPPAWPRWQMTPLDRGDMITLVGLAVPHLAPAISQSVAEHLLLITGGIPLYVQRAVLLLVDIGVLRHDDGTWVADEPDRLVPAISRLSLQRDPLFPNQMVEQALLSYLEIAEEPVGYEELGEALSGHAPPDIPDIVERFAFAGWVHVGGENGESASLAHAIVAEQVENAVPAGMRTELQRKRAMWLHRHGTTLAHLQAAVRLYLAADLPRQALAAVRSWRRRGASRVSGFGDMLVPEGATWWFRLRLRLATSAWEGVALVGMAMGVVAAIGWVYWTGQPAELRLENQPVVEPSEPAARSTSNTEPPLLTVRDHWGNISRALDGKELGIVADTGVTSVSLPRKAIVRAGRVEVTSIDLVAPDHFDSVMVHFSVGSIRSGPVVLNRGWTHFSLQLAEGTLAGQSVGGSRPTIRIRTGDSIAGEILLRYTAPTRPATYMLAESSTLKDFRTDTTTLISLLPGALDATVSIRVRRLAPTTPGTYWLLWAFAAETNASSILSNTNWACGKAIWDDGNDVLAAPDSLLHLPDWGHGVLNVRKMFCKKDQQPTYGPDDLRVAAVRVIVEKP